MRASLGARVAQADEKLVGSQGGGSFGDNLGRIPDYRIRLSLDLLVPGLFPPHGAPESMRALRLPALEAALADAAVERQPARGADAWLAGAFEVPQPVPHAAICLAGEGLPREGAWLHADPVHLAIGQDAVALRDASSLGVTREEANDFVAALQAHFEPDGLVFLSPAPDRWYVRVPADEVPATTPLAAALGRNIFGLLPRGGGRINWPAALTEAQMLLTSHPANQRREAARLSAVNAVWFWGEGAAPARVGRPYHAIVGGDAFVRGLARLSGAGGALEGERVLVVLDAADRSLRSGDGGAWAEALRVMEAEWFARLGELARAHGTVRLLAPGDEGTRAFTFRARRRWRLFSRPRPFAEHA